MHTPSSETIETGALSNDVDSDIQSDGRTRKSFRPCHRCRQRHIKCLVDGEQGSCKGCMAAELPCTGRGDLVFKMSRLVRLGHAPNAPPAHLDNLQTVPSAPRTRSAQRPSRRKTLPLTTGSGADAPRAEHFRDVRHSDNPIEDSAGLGQVMPIESFPNEEQPSERDVITATPVPSGRIEHCSVSKHLVIAPLPIVPSTASSTSDSGSLGRDNPFCSTSLTFPQLTHRPQDSIDQPLDDLDLVTSISYGAYEPQCIEHWAAVTEASGTTQTWPLRDAHEAQLLKYFCNHLALWFDYSDPLNHFGSYVVGLAAQDRALLYAILAVAAKHQSRVTGRDDGIGDTYQRHCLDMLIPALNDPTHVLSDKLLASALILRLFEEMTAEPTADGETTSHTLSVQILLKIKQGEVFRSSLSDAAFIVALRQEIFIGNLTQRPLEPIVQYCNIDTSLDAAEDATWTSRIIAQAAEISNFAYSSQPRTPAMWEVYQHYVQEWFRLKPISFRPTARSQLPDSFFPQIWFAGHVHVAAFHYYKLCTLLLTALDTRIPVLGLRRAEALELRDERMRTTVREMCGAAISNGEWFPPKLTAGLAIAMCGELFYDPEERKQLLRLLADAEIHIGWRCLKVGDKLRRLWHLD